MSVPAARPATPADADAIGLVHARSWQAACRGMLPREYLDRIDPAQRADRWRRVLAGDGAGRDGILVAEVPDGGIIGFVSFGATRDSDLDTGDTGEVYALYAAPASWGTGAGRALLSGAVAGLARVGYADAALWVLDSNDRARRFYARAGWAPDGAVKIEPGLGFDLTEVRYRRALSARDQ